MELETDGFGILAQGRSTERIGNRGWPLLAFGFGGLVALILLSGLAAYRYAGQIRRQVEENQKASIGRDQALDELRFHTLSLAIEIRDYLLDSSPDGGAQQRLQLLKRREGMLRSLFDMDRLSGTTDSAAARELRHKIDEYWSLIDTVLRWTPKERRERAAEFLSRTVIPSRQAVLDLTAGISRTGRLVCRLNSRACQFSAGPKPNSSRIEGRNPLAISRTARSVCSASETAASMCVSGVETRCCSRFPSSILSAVNICPTSS